MKVFSAIMLDEEQVADHNCPTLLLAFHPDALHSMVREHVKSWSNWREALGMTNDAPAEIDKMSLDDMNEMLCETAPHLFIHTSCEEV